MVQYTLKIQGLNILTILLYNRVMRVIMMSDVFLVFLWWRKIINKCEHDNKKCVFKKSEIFILLHKVLEITFGKVFYEIMVLVASFVKFYPQVSTNGNIFKYLMEVTTWDSKYCQNHQNGVTSCFPKRVKKKWIELNYQSSWSNLQPKTKRIFFFWTRPYLNYRKWSGILNHCVV